MRFFIDTEFIESGPGKPIQLISIGLVNQVGVSMYEISSEFNPDDASEWVKENVLSKLEADKPRNTLACIGWKIQHFISHSCHLAGDNKIEFWGYYADYDWVVFCQIFGTMMDLPKGFPMYCRDIKQLCDDKGNPKLPEQGKGEHNALADAKWNREAFTFLAAIPEENRMTLAPETK